MLAVELCEEKQYKEKVKVIVIMQYFVAIARLAAYGNTFKHKLK